MLCCSNDFPGTARHIIPEWGHRPDVLTGGQVKSLLRIRLFLKTKITADAVTLLEREAGPDQADLARVRMHLVQSVF